MEDITFTFETVALIERARRGCSFYRALYSTHRVELDGIRSREDLAMLPIVTPTDLSNHPEGFRSSEVHVFRVTSSSGTVHTPKTLYRTERDSQISTTVMCRLFRMAGLLEGDTLWIGQPFDLAHLGYLCLEACKILRITAIPGGLSVTDQRLFNLLRQFQPTAIFTSPSRMCNVTAWFAENPAGRPSFRHILLAGEPCSLEQLKQITNFWHVKPHNLYGSEETDGLGGSCRMQDGIHFMDDLFHLDLVQPETNNHVAAGEPGEAVITSLYAEGTPLIRYRLGDMVERLPGGCECGARWPRIRVLGRNTLTFFLYDGIKLHSYQVREALRSVHGDIDKFQAILRQLEDGSEEVEFILPRIVEDGASLASSVEDALWSSSLDLDAARSIGKLKFRISTTGRYLTSYRGKSPEFIDLRDERQKAQFPEADTTR